MPGVLALEADLCAANLAGDVLHFIIGSNHSSNAIWFNTLSIKWILEVFLAIAPLLKFFKQLRFTSEQSFNVRFCDLFFARKVWTL